MSGEARGHEGWRVRALASGVILIAALAGTWPVTAASAGTPGCAVQVVPGSGANCPFFVYGHVTYQDATPASGVAMTDGAGNSTTTDSQGFYEFPELKPDNYEVTAQAPPPNFGCAQSTQVSFDPVLSAATGGTRADLQLPCVLPPPAFAQWAGPPNQVLVVNGPNGEAIGLTIGGDCITITVNGKLGGAACGGSGPSQLGPEQWFPDIGCQIPGGWADAVQVGVNAKSMYGVASDGTRVSGLISVDGWGLVAGPQSYLNPEVYDYNGLPMQSAKP